MTPSADQVAAFVRDSGLDILERDLLDALRAGARLRLLTGDYLRITQAEALERARPGEVHDPADGGPREPSQVLLDQRQPLAVGLLRQPGPAALTHVGDHVAFDHDVLGAWAHKHAEANSETLHRGGEVEHDSCRQPPKLDRVLSEWPNAISEVKRPSTPGGREE